MSKTLKKYHVKMWIVLTIVFYLLIVLYMGLFCIYWDGFNPLTMEPTGGISCLFLTDNQSALMNKMVGHDPNRILGSGLLAASAIYTGIQIRRLARKPKQLTK